MLALMACNLACAAVQSCYQSRAAVSKGLCRTRTSAAAAGGAEVGSISGAARGLQVSLSRVCCILPPRGLLAWVLPGRRHPLPSRAPALLIQGLAAAPQRGAALQQARGQPRRGLRQSHGARSPSSLSAPKPQTLAVRHVSTSDPRLIQLPWRRRLQPSSAATGALAPGGRARAPSKLPTLRYGSEQSLAHASTTLICEHDEAFPEKTKSATQGLWCAMKSVLHQPAATAFNRPAQPDR